jgi:predicted transcriptional regulator of viral defense system
LDTSDRQIAAIAERQHGVFSRAQGRRCGFTDDQIDGRLERGLWVPEHRGVYKLHGVPTTFEGSAMAAVLAAGRGACASHQTAAGLWKLHDVGSDHLELTVRGRKRTRIPGVLVHLPRTLASTDTTKIGVIPVTTPMRTLIDLAGCVGVSDLEDALDEAVRRDLVSIQRLTTRLRATSPNGRRGISSLATLTSERVGTPTSGSDLENRVRRAFREGGLPIPVPQYKIYEPDGTFVAKVDFAYPHVRLAIEVDSVEHHFSRKAFEHDRVRQNRAVALGWSFLRTTKRQLNDHSGDVIALVWRHLTALEAAQRHQTASS